MSGNPSGQEKTGLPLFFAFLRKLEEAMNRECPTCGHRPQIYVDIKYVCRACGHSEEGKEVRIS